MKYLLLIIPIAIALIVGIPLISFGLGIWSGEPIQFLRDFSSEGRSEDTAEWYLDQGNAHYNLGQFEQAIEGYDEAIRLNPQLTEAHYNRGIAYASLGEFEPAIRDYDQTIRLNPQNAHAYYDRGVASYNLGQFERAIEDYDEAIRLNPQNRLAYFNRGLVRREQGKIAEAIADFEKFISLADNPQWIEIAKQKTEELSK